MASNELTSAQRRYLKQQAHHLKPLLQMGKDGATPAFGKALDEQLAAHELVKFKILNNCLASSDEIKSIITSLDAALIQKVGHIYTVFKQRPEDSWFTLPK